jgi:beta-xylosidase
MRSDAVWVLRAYRRAPLAERELSPQVATGPTPLGPFTDSGAPLARDETGRGMYLDSHYFYDSATATPYLVWKHGSVTPPAETHTWLYMQPLDRTGTKLLGEKRIVLRNDLGSWEQGVVEAPWIVKPRGSSFYYLFYSAAHCCDGSGSYAVGVARATAVTGPYEKYGENPILHSNTGDVGFDGPGHCSVIESPDDPQEWIIFYHSYVRPATSGARALMMDTLTFDAAAGGRPGGWPRLSTGTKSPSTAPTPLPPTTARQAAPAPWRYHGVVFGGGEWSSADAPLGSAASDSSLRAAIASGASAIRLIPTCEPSHRVLYLGVEGRGRARGRRRA